MNKNDFLKYLKAFNYKKEICSIDDAMDFYKEIKTHEKNINEWMICKQNLSNFFNFSTKNKTKNACYLAYQSFMVNNIYAELRSK